jgi:hypothetical protein
VRKEDVKIGEVYLVKVSDLIAPVKILRDHPVKGWIGRNLRTLKEVRIKSAGRLRSKVT